MNEINIQEIAKRLPEAKIYEIVEEYVDNTKKRLEWIIKTINSCKKNQNTLTWLKKQYEKYEAKLVALEIPVIEYITRYTQALKEN